MLNNPILFAQFLHNMCIIVKTQTQPTTQLNRVWGKTSFLHRDPPTHPTPHKLYLYTQNWTELKTAQIARRDLSVQVNSQTQTSAAILYYVSRRNFNFFQTKGIWFFFVSEFENN